MSESELQFGRFESAARYCERLLAARPDDASAWHRHAIALLELGEPLQAVASLDRALRLVPAAADVLQDKALALSRLFRREEALRCFEESILRRPEAEQDFHRLSLLVELGRDREVVELAGQLAAVHPERTDLIVTLGWAQLWLGDIEHGLSTFERIVASGAGGIPARMHAAYAHLIAGRFERGWQLYESRTAGVNPLVQGPSRAPEWRGGTALSGKRLLVYAEQGIGDSLQFCRYVPLLLRDGAHVTVQAPPALHDLLGSLAPGLPLAGPGDPVPADLQCPMPSLPYAFGTRLGTIPAEVPYLSAPDPRIEAWRQRLGPRRRLRVGVACSGNARHAADRRRSMPMARIASWLQTGCEFHLLQTDVRAADEEFLRASGIRDHRTDLSDLVETAALISCLDLVISVDTSIAHLAGALGRPVWILLSRPSEWRWLLERNDSPWYPTARLFRMGDRGQWRGVVDAVAAALTEASG